MLCIVLGAELDDCGDPFRLYDSSKRAEKALPWKSMPPLALHPLKEEGREIESSPMPHTALPGISFAMCSSARPHACFLMPQTALTGCVLLSPLHAGVGPPAGIGSGSSHLPCIGRRLPLAWSQASPGRRAAPPAIGPPGPFPVALMANLPLILESGGDRIHNNDNKRCCLKIKGIYWGE